jgi:hypothetical protein
MPFNSKTGYGAGRDMAEYNRCMDRQTALGAYGRAWYILINTI